MRNAPIARLSVLCVALLWSAPAAAEENWELFARSKSADLRFDRGSVSEAQGYVRYQVRIEYREDRETRDKTYRYRSAITGYAAQCDAGKVALTSVILFDEAGQRLTARSRAADRWDEALKEVRADGVQERLLKHACAIARGEDPPAPDPKAQVRRATIRLGAGIVATRGGMIVTNHHVVDDCTAISVVDSHKGRAVANVVAADAKNDLALLKADRSFEETATFRKGIEIQAGESVTVVGYPLASILGSIEPNVSFGYVSATAGVRGDRSRFQISAPIHKGNSGGPILDQSGNVTGIVSAKLNALAVQKKTGDLPQNISFGVKGEVAQAFLDSQNVRYRDGAKRDRLENTEVAAIGKAITVLVACRKTPPAAGEER